MNLDNEDAAGSVGNATNQKKQTERKLVYIQIPLLDIVEDTT